MGRRLEEIEFLKAYPDENNPRRHFEGLDELAASFELNRDRPGEPFEPIKVVRDGEHYVIADGERRFRAMEKAGKSGKIEAMVYDTWEDADIALAALATDQKQLLDDAEKGRGVQRALQLGVEPVKVDSAARTRNAARVRAGMARVGAEAAEQMSLDHLAMVAEWEERGDADAADKIAAAREDKWEAVAAKLEWQRKHDEAEAALRAWAGEVEVELVDYDSLPEDKRWSYTNGRKPAGKENAGSEHEPAACAQKWIELAESDATDIECALKPGKYRSYDSMPSVVFFANMADEKARQEAERAERLARIEELDALLDRADAERDAWFFGLKKDDVPGGLNDSIAEVLLKDARVSYRYALGDLVEKAGESFGWEPDGELSDYDLVMGWNALPGRRSGNWGDRVLDGSAGYDGNARSMREWLAFGTRMISWGFRYSPEVRDSDIVASIRELVNKWEKEHKEEGGDE